MSTRAGAYALVATLLASAGAGAQTSRYYLASGDQHLMAVVQGGALVNQWNQANSPNQGGEYALAVSGDIRTLNNGGYGSGLGSQYTLGGTYTGTTYAYPVPGAAFYDGTTDGTWNYSVDYHNGDVWRMDRNWANPSLLFATGRGQELGISWDASSNTMWTAGYGNGNVNHWTLGGVLLSSFSSGFGATGSLAMDYADGTLWLTTQQNYGTIYHYSTSGASLGSVSGLPPDNFLGGEFDVAAVVTPEPGTIVLLVSGLLLVAPIVRRRTRHA